MFMVVSRLVILRNKNVLGKNYWENQNTHFMLSNICKNRLWDNVEK